MRMLIVLHLALLGGMAFAGPGEVCGEYVVAEPRLEGFQAIYSFPKGQEPVTDAQVEEYDACWSVDDDRQYDKLDPDRVYCSKVLNLEVDSE